MNASLKRVASVVALLVATVSLAPAASGQVPLPPLPGSSPSPEPEPSPEPKPSPKPKPKPSEPDDDGSKPSRDGGSNKSSGSTARTLSREERSGLKDWLTREHTGARTTTRLLELIDDAAVEGKATVEEKRAAFGRFPVVGYVWYQDDYGAPRWRGHYVFHAGVDLFAVKGTPVNSVVSGEITRIGYWSMSGNAIWLAGDDGVRYYFGHLQRYRSDLEVGSRVEQGELLGWVGDTGSAKGTYPHLHFEVNPGGLGTVNPKPLLDAWLRDAEVQAVARVEQVARDLRLAPMGAAGWDTLFSLMGESEAIPPAMWTAGLAGSATLGQLDLALAHLATARSWTDGLTFGDQHRSWDQLGALEHHS